MDKMLPPAGHCIYCDPHGLQEPPLGLEKEHIMPLGLNGHLVLPAASCRKHAAITGRIEQMLLRGSFRAARLQFGLRSRGNEPVPTQLPVFTSAGPDARRIMVDVAEYPTAIVLPMFLKPANLLRGWPKGMGTDQHGAWLYEHPVDHDLLSKKYGISDAYRPHQIEGTLFRVLAKIAHAYTAASFPKFSGLSPLLTQFIVGEEDEINRYSYVGGLPTIPPPDDTLHWTMLNIEQAQGVQVIVCYIRLFAHLGSPVFAIATAACPPDRKLVVVDPITGTERPSGQGSWHFPAAH